MSTGVIEVDPGALSMHDAGGELVPSINTRAELRIQVDAWCALEKASEQYMVRPRSVRLVWNYFRHVGAKAVWRKIRSRMSETQRNNKVAAIGIGVVSAVWSECGWQCGDSVAFFAPNYAPQATWICLNEAFVRPIAWLESVQSDGGSDELAVGPLRPYIGWSPFSGSPLSCDVVEQGLMLVAPRLRRLLQQVDSAGASRAKAPWTERRDATLTKLSPKPTAVLFGLGNYAKTQIIPAIRRDLDLRCIHDIDPDQLAAASRWGVALDTSPYPRSEERYDAWLIAGYHHTHADIAITAMERGGYAIIEKPIATEWRQLHALEAALQKGKYARLFACLQRRYSPMNNWLIADLGAHRETPINYHCIVYEIPLPARHWYNWPNSRSRLTSNGCHWIDHFMFLNSYSHAISSDVYRAHNGDIQVRVELENGAFFTMTLTDRGSERLGVRDHVELHVGNVTVQMIDQTFYMSETTSHVLRKRKINPMRSYMCMYSAIAGKVVSGESGDGLETLSSARLTLELEDQLASKRERS